ncbi:hypothetical protein [Sphingobium fuliginis]|uniref:Uncharacterized protein n=1 Tax=Sphingobium fuliginis ATCC 27551 TaxID=1208342 RepID=A0A5B8CC69_SPHSA|nr:hypothetical protein [Sphingobium fuliginis]QDC37064.1 hypothetical protein FIL70_07350 [Sphingobium fuliginis ATCC 27551]
MASMTPDIIAALEALKQYGNVHGVLNGSDRALICNATAKIEAALSTSPASQEVRRLREALQPFAAMGDHYTSRPDDIVRDGAYSGGSPGILAQVTLGDYRRAKAALAEPANPSVEPAGNGREAIERFLADYDDGDRADAGTNPLMEAHIADFRAALSSPPAAEQEAVKCKRCNDTGWIIGNGTVREGCLSCDAQINMARATPPAPALDGVREALRVAISDLQATYDAAKSGKPLEISIGQWGRLNRMKAALSSSPKVSREAVRELALQTAADANSGYIDAKTKKIVNAALNYALAALSSPSDGESAPASSGTGDHHPLPGLFDPKHDEAIKWITANCMAIRRDNGDMDYSLGAMIAAYEAGKSSAPLSHDAEGESATVSREGETLGCDYCNNDGPLIRVKGHEPRCPRCDAEYPDEDGTPATSTERGR